MNNEDNMRLMKMLDDAWNSQDWRSFSNRHADNVTVRWPGRAPTKGIKAHKKECEYFFNAFPDNHVGNDPYKILFGQGNWTCSVAEFTGTHAGLMKGLDGNMIPATNKTFNVDFCTVAHWKNAKIVEENLFYDIVSMMKQLGLK